LAHKISQLLAYSISHQSYLINPVELSEISRLQIHFATSSECGLFYINLKQHIIVLP